MPMTIQQARDALAPTTQKYLRAAGNLHLTVKQAACVAGVTVPTYLSWRGGAVPVHYHVLHNIRAFFAAFDGEPEATQQELTAPGHKAARAVWLEERLGVQPE